MFVVFHYSEKEKQHKFQVFMRCFARMIGQELSLCFSALLRIVSLGKVSTPQFHDDVFSPEKLIN
jgi:hypothetical protein